MKAEENSYKGKKKLVNDKQTCTKWPECFQQAIAQYKQLQGQKFIHTKYYKTVTI